MQGQLEGPAEAYFIDGETEGYRDGRFSFKFTQQVVARPETEPYILLHVVGPWQRPPLPLIAVVSLRVRGNKDRGGVS